MNRKIVYEKRPFKTRNADQFSLADVLSLFVAPVDGLASPFDYENSIIKGRMGSGKTMYLRANQAFYLHGLIPSLVAGGPIVLPVFIRLSDFQHLTEPKEIYRGIIIKIAEEISQTAQFLTDSYSLAKLHESVRGIREQHFPRNAQRITQLELKKLSSEEYVERVSAQMSCNGSISYSFLKLSAKFQKENLIELKQKKEPGIQDIENCYSALLQRSDAQILLLIDEAGSLTKDFFNAKENGAYFEILLNQFRTASFIRTKVAIYPNSYQDTLTETRYGDIVRLEENVLDRSGYNDFRFRTENLIWSYINHEFLEQKIDLADLFQSNENDLGDCIEQIINGSGGNMRRLIQLLDFSMCNAFARNKGEDRVTIDDVNVSIQAIARNMMGQFSDYEKRFLAAIAGACKSRGTYRFRFPNNTVELIKYTNKSKEQNVLRVIQSGRGRGATIYGFDYCYCIANEIPTHYIANTEKIDKSRSFLGGKWIDKVTTISFEILDHASQENKINGTVYLMSNERSGTIKGEDGTDYIFIEQFIISACRDQTIIQGSRVRFSPFPSDNNLLALGIEIL